MMRLKGVEIPDRDHSINSIDCIYCPKAWLFVKFYQIYPYFSGPAYRPRLYNKQNERRQKDLLRGGNRFCLCINAVLTDTLILVLEIHMYVYLHPFPLDSISLRKCSP